MKPDVISCILHRVRLQKPFKPQLELNKYTRGTISYHDAMCFFVLEQDEVNDYVYINFTAWPQHTLIITIIL